MTSATSLKSIRLAHQYMGVFFAPTILFFAVTGCLQMFGLHETSRGNSYVPPAILVHLSQLHKKGTLYLPPRKPAPSAPAKADGQKSDATKPDVPKSPATAPASPAPNPLPISFLRCNCFSPSDVDLHGAFYVLEICTPQSCGCWSACCGSRLPADLLAFLMVGTKLSNFLAG